MHYVDDNSIKDQTILQQLQYKNAHRRKKDIYV